MASKSILEEFFDKKELSILKVFLADPAARLYLREVAKKARVPNATTFRIVAKFRQISVVEETLVRKTKLYSLAQNDNTRLLSELFEDRKSIVKELVETISRLPAAQSILPHGEEQKNKVELIILGDWSDADKKAINEKVGDIKYKHEFTIIPTIVNYQQFTRLLITKSISSIKDPIWERPSENRENQS